MSFLSRLFGSSKTTDKIVDAVIATGDALFHTDEEKTKANLEAFKLKIEFAKATSNSRLARRVLAFGIVGVFLLNVQAAIVYAVLGDLETSSLILDITAKTLGTLVTVVVGFYFATQVTQAMRK